ncbi:hypothetical protein [Burkholderia arboris]|uniref:hypothetical protein n=1 Tax=Burkholderia arboris TaxID=488730 RepID=UPI00158A1ADA|nr:hypothetical protein [Burkholderia arboris]
MSSSIGSVSPVVPALPHEPDVAPDDRASAGVASRSGSVSRRASIDLAERTPRGSVDTGSIGRLPRVSNAALDAHRARRASGAASADGASLASAHPSVAPAPMAPGSAGVRFTPPRPCSGALTRGEHGRLHCAQDQGVQGVLDLMWELDPDAVANLEIPPDSTISLEWDENLVSKMREFMQFADGNLLVVTDLLRDAIAKYEGAFTPATRMPDGGPSPSEFLRNLGIRIRVTPTAEVGAHLQAILDRQYDAPGKRARIARFRHDFGAMSLLSLATSKEFSTQLAYGIGIGVAGSGAIGGIFDYGIWASAKRAMSAATAAAVGPLLDSLTPLFAETYDSIVIPRLIHVMKGGNFMPENAGEAWATLRSASFAGAIAAVGSIANNYVRELSIDARQAGHTEAAAALLVAKQLTNLLMTWISGAIIPLEVMGDHKQLVKAKLGLIESGVLPRPDVADFRQHVSESTLNTIRTARGTGSAIRSMATSGEIAVTIGLLLSILEHYGLVSNSLEQLITLMYSTPAEVIGITASMAHEKWVGADGGEEHARITTEQGKQSAMLARIARHEETGLDDLDRIARPDGERNAALGYLVTTVLGAAMNVVDKGADIGIHYAGATLAGVGRALSPVGDMPYVGPALTAMQNGASGASRLARDHAVEPLGRGARTIADVAQRYAIEPAGQGIAWAIDKADPVMAPVAKGAAAAATATGQHVLRPVANAVAVTVDTVARMPGAAVDIGAKAIEEATSSATDTLARVARRRQASRRTGSPGPDGV